MFNDKTILITGGSGSWGNELTSQLLEKYSPKKIKIYSRNEPKQITMKRNFKNNPKLKFVIGDIRDYNRLDEVCYDVDYIFHLAVLKHFSICEENVGEAIKINILGTQNIIKTAIKNSIKKVIYISTDKAVEPLNLYGLTKAIGEKLIIAANNSTENTSFVCIRTGNVLGTSESVIPVFRKQILNINKITITDGEMTRFFLNLKQAISLIFKASIDSIGGEIFIVPMPAVKIDDLADLMIKELGNEQTEKIIIGKRPGEKDHELLISREESVRTFKFEDCFLILPLIEIEKIKNYYNVSKLEKVEFEEYGSKNARRLNSEEIKEMLDNENWLAKEKTSTNVKKIGWTKKEDF